MDETMVMRAIESLAGRSFVGVLHIQRACGLSYASARIIIDELTARGYLRRVWGAEAPYRVCKSKESPNA